MAYTSGHTGNVVRPSNRLVRERFARFLGEPKTTPIHQSLGRRDISLWNDSQIKTTHSHRQQSLDPIQLAVNDVLQRLRSREWEAFVVGGTLRDLVCDSSVAKLGSITPRDIDIVVVNASDRDLKRCFWDLVARHTRFGGLHLIKNLAQIGEVHFDIWPLPDTWALKHFHISPQMSTFVDTPFLNLDAIALELYPKLGHQRRLYDHGFYEGITSKTIDINFEPNPFPDVCIVRALIMAVKLQFGLSRRLASFISSKADENARILDDLLRAQVSHYGQVRCLAGELDSWLSSIRQQLESGCGRVELVVPRTRQFGLWADYPPIHKASLRDDTEADPSPTLAAQ